MKTTILASLALMTLAAGCSSGGDDTAAADESNVTSGVTSAYTDLGPLAERCSQTESGEGGYASWDCAGMGAYGLRVEAFDARENIVITTPSGDQRDLKIQQATGSGFGHLGTKAEWRGTFVATGKVNPTALIFRYIEANPETGRDAYENLLVARLTQDDACLVGVIDATSANANDQARVIADHAENARCVGVQPSDH